MTRLEDEVYRLSRDIEGVSPSRDPSSIPSPEDTEARTREIRGKVLFGLETKYFSPFSWPLVAEEFSDLNHVLRNYPRDASGLASSPQEVTPIEIDTPGLLDEQLHETLLSIFRHRVDPLVRVLHWPSFIERARLYRHPASPQTHQTGSDQFAGPYFTENQFNTPRQNGMQPPGPPHNQQTNQHFVALLYTVYYAAIVAIIDSPNPPELGQDISVFNHSFKREVMNRVLSLDKRVKLPESLQILQAMVLWLSVEPGSFNLQYQWNQLGVAIRMAQGLGIHRDGSSLDLLPIEIEIRRRVWAQICVLDVQYAEQLGREPSIATDSYDTMLPLSIDDRDLAVIEEQVLTGEQGHDTNFKTLEEIEQGQRKASPFSAMTFSLVQTELARMSSHLLTVRYRARDNIFSNLAFNELGRTHQNSTEMRAEKAYCVNRLEHRFGSVYAVGSLDSSDLKQQLVSELVSISLFRAKFLNRTMEWKDCYSSMSESRRENETLTLLRDAIGVATRTLTLIHRFSTSPFSWYTKRFRDMYSSSFIAFNLATRQKMDQQFYIPAWSALDQLYPVDATGCLVEQSIHDSSFGKLLASARVRKEHQSMIPTSQDFREQIIHVPTSTTFPTTSGAVTLAYSTASANAGNLYEEYDSMIQNNPSNIGNNELTLFHAIISRPQYILFRCLNGVTRINDASERTTAVKLDTAAPIPSTSSALNSNTILSNICHDE
ncbi:fungal-specific transcription factor domain-containing protein [Dendryphion nanum]|uniref:Fungal-specific transcription factor domain-containing protein n=1 Tax=Dendryphion nanum TaxID=256645 RepID=A0A9P9E6Y0_9PLEO|nr:fungal-specific transcription factor domain-containing protein [Dendryphion nanum]